MSRVSRREFLALSAAGAAIAGPGAQAAQSSAAAPTLSSVTRNVQPIDAAEHGVRLAKLQGLMQQRKNAALLVEAGSSLEYFTGIRWWRSERTTAAIVPAEGPVVVVTPAFEEPSIR
ncbi:MAG: aminopeptidase P family N-terminal domain-containing protein, partial [Gammaproteobacteria bacterium]|nr:aminopeptidase P family N-terminal domain-containing protein [Gammaproteobacteria bacterium]